MLTHARMRSSNPAQRQGVVVFLQKRLAVIYPLYALGLLLALLVQWWRGRALTRASLVRWAGCRTMLASGRGCTLE